MIWISLKSISNGLLNSGAEQAGEPLPESVMTQFTDTYMHPQASVC